MKAFEPMKPMDPMPPLSSKRWWPETFGLHPTWLGSSNGIRYAYFREGSRLIVAAESGQDVFDTGDYTLTGVASSSTSEHSLEFSDLGGAVLRLDDFKRIKPD
jgi:hypothetical protein